MFQQPFRLTPAGPASAYQTFQIRTPRGPEFDRPVTCEEVDCDAWRNGWITRVPFGSELEHTVRVARSRHPWAAAQAEGGEMVFTYAPGTPCFRSATHRLPIRPDLPQIFLVKDGDWRGNPRGTQPRIHQRPEDWVEHAQEVTANVVDRIERG